MKLEIEKNDFLTSLGHVRSVVENRNTIPILANVMLEAKADGLKVATTDMDIAITDSADANIITEGSTTTPAGTLFDVVRKMPDGAQISLELKDNKLTIAAGRTRFHLATLPVDGFPVMTGGDMPHNFTIGADTLLQLIENTSFAISTEETRYYLNGIYFHTEASKLNAVATDGHRLAKASIKTPKGAEDIPGVIVPRKTIAELHKLLEQTDSDVEISLSDTKIKFTVNHVILTSKLVDGTFPDYKRVIPKGNPEKFQVDAKMFAVAVDRVATMADGKMRPIKLSVDGGVLSLKATNADFGDGSDEIEVDYNGPKIEIGFNARYLLDVTNTIKNKTALFEIKDETSPSVIRSKDDNSVLFVIMPMRV